MHHHLWEMVRFELASCSNIVSSTTFNPSSFDQPFVVGPGFSPVPPKLVAQITIEKLIELRNLLSANLQQTKPEPQLLLDGRLVFTAQPKKQQRCIQEIASWLDVFTIYTLVTVSRFSHQWRDLTQYKLLILLTYHHFSGQVWLDFDRAFRKHAAATNLTDRSNINGQLFSFHSASFPARNQLAQATGSKAEPAGSTYSLVTCISQPRIHTVVFVRAIIAFGLAQIKLLALLRMPNIKL